MIGCLWTCVHKQPIIALHFEFETVLKFITSRPGLYDSDKLRPGLYDRWVLKL